MVRTRTMKIIEQWHDGFPPQGLFRGTVGQPGVYPYAYGTDPLRGRPLGGSGVHRR
jgi:hypothetical protein